MQQYSTMANNGLAAPAAVHRRPWTVEEDRVLVQYVNAIGEGSWNCLARDARLNRTGRSCRLRWRNYLRPDLRRGKMTAEEQDVIVHLQSQWGNRWSKIAKQLPGRTDNDVKNFWKTNIQQHKKKRRRRQRDKVDDITAATDLCSSVDSGDTCTLATTEAQGCSSSNNNSGGGGTTTTTTTTGVDGALLVTHDYGIVAAHQPASMCCLISVEEGHLGDQQVPGAAAGGTWSATQVHPGLLAASGENFWGVDDYSWSTTQSCLGNNGGTWSAAEFHPELLAASGGNLWAIDDYSWSTTQSCLGNNDSRIGCWDTHTRARQYSRL